MSESKNKKNKTGLEIKMVEFNCTSCQQKYKAMSCHKEDVVNIYVCSNCHPFYLGKANLSRNLGPAEKLKDKFSKGKEIAEKNKK